MSDAYKCDKCGQLFEQNKIELRTRKYELSLRGKICELDLCEKCYSEFEEWFTGCIQVRDCLHCKYSKNGKINSHETCHECMLENQFEPIIKIKTCSTCKYYFKSSCDFPCNECNNNQSNYISKEETK